MARYWAADLRTQSENRARQPHPPLPIDKVTRVSSLLERRESVARGKRLRGSRLLVVGVLTFAAVLVGWLVYACTHPAAATIDPVDLGVYRNGGLIIRHVSPPYDSSFKYPLYDWPKSKVALKFTYTPFAAIFFAAIAWVPWSVLPQLSQVANLLLLITAAWFTTGMLTGAGADRPSWRARLGGTLLGAAAGLVTEPVFRTLYLGQVNLLLMAAIIWDLRQPDSRRLKGLGVGAAAGIKLVPLIFILYLLLTRRLRAAAVAAATFAATVILGFIIVPGDSGDWWLHGLFFADGRTGFVGWGGNQSLRGILTRLAGSISGAGTSWVIAVVLVAVVGLASAVLLDRAGHAMLAILATALTGLLDSPISWDHHWVWVVPGIMAAAYYANRAWQAQGNRAAAYWCGALTGVMLLVYFPWPGSFWSVPVTGPGDFTAGLIWAGPNSKVSTYVLLGDNPAFKEYHWQGLQNLSGNAFILAGAALLILLAVVAIRTRRAAAALRA
jgi:alpha-1,2-mannosyltransferase